jgi:integrase
MAAQHGYLANRIHATLSAFFAWAVDRELVEVSPMLGMHRPMRREQSRDRVLDDGELAVVWRAVARLTPDRCNATRMLILTGCRLSEVTGMTWEEVANGTWSLPGSRTKNGQGRDIHLTPLMLQVMGPTGEGRVFPGAEGLGKDAIPDLVKTLPMPNWRLHDLRRSVASGLQALGVQPVVVDKLLGHSAVVKGVAAVYARHEYLAERKAALELWSAHVGEII